MRKLSYPATRWASAGGSQRYSYGVVLGAVALGLVAGTGSRAGGGRGGTVVAAGAGSGFFSASRFGTGDRVMPPRRPGTGCSGWHTACCAADSFLRCPCWCGHSKRGCLSNNLLLLAGAAPVGTAAIAPAARLLGLVVLGGHFLLWTSYWHHAQPRLARTDALEVLLLSALLGALPHVLAGSVSSLCSGTACSTCCA